MEEKPWVSVEQAVAPVAEQQRKAVGTGADQQRKAPKPADSHEGARAKKAPKREASKAGQFYDTCKQQQKEGAGMPPRPERQKQRKPEEAPPDNLAHQVLVTGLQ